LFYSFKSLEVEKIANKHEIGWSQLGKSLKIDEDPVFGDSDLIEDLFACGKKLFFMETNQIQTF
jgi:hypothetical protein